mmetsp:Transcript_40455/g.111451  ORF Transcript_40455/g.111451 Transcript_40455/m.111451 type:complete len:158 (-) Transcript_40455:145-618(-)
MTQWGPADTLASGAPKREEAPPATDLNCVEGTLALELRYEEHFAGLPSDEMWLSSAEAMALQKLLQYGLPQYEPRVLLVSEPFDLVPPVGGSDGMNLDDAWQSPDGTFFSPGSPALGAKAGVMLSGVSPPDTLVGVVNGAASATATSSGRCANVGHL